MSHAGLKNIANVTARAASSLVKPGTTVDVYAVNAATATQLQISGGGNNIDNAYSAIYSMPGVNGLPGNYGFGQVFYIHGSSYNQIGYEFDGIPVNRAFDNYNANSLSNLGAQSTEVYTGGGPAAGTSATLGGYINQVIKTGTYPGSITLGAGLGAPAFYHQAQVEGGGATPDRLFSYYVGIRGANQIPNQIDSQNASDLNQDGNNQFGVQGVPWNTLMEPFTIFGFNGSRGPWSDCNANGSAKADGSYLSPALAAAYGVKGPMPTCNMYGPVYGALSLNLRGNDLSDRENVMNFHFGIPHHKDSGKDDIQILFDNFFYQTSGWDNISTNGGLGFMNATESPAGSASGLGNYNTWVANEFFGAPGNYLGPAQMPSPPGFVRGTICSISPEPARTAPQPDTLRPHITTLIRSSTRTSASRRSARRISSHPTISQAPIPTGLSAPDSPRTRSRIRTITARSSNCSTRRTSARMPSCACSDTRSTPIGCRPIPTTATRRSRSALRRSRTTS